MTDVYITIPSLTVQEAGSFTATAYFRVAGAASASATSSSYRIDNITTGAELQDWTALTPAVSISISVTSAHNKIQQTTNRVEKVQLTVASDRGETSANYDSVIWTIENKYGYTGNT